MSTIDNLIVRLTNELLDTQAQLRAAQMLQIARPPVQPPSEETTLRAQIKAQAATLAGYQDDKEIERMTAAILKLNAENRRVLTENIDLKKECNYQRGKMNDLICDRDSRITGRDEVISDLEAQVAELKLRANRTCTRAAPTHASQCRYSACCGMTGTGRSSRSQNSRPSSTA